MAQFSIRYSEDQDDYRGVVFNVPLQVYRGLM